MFICSCCCHSFVLVTFHYMCCCYKHHHPYYYYHHHHTSSCVYWCIGCCSDCYSISTFVESDGVMVQNDVVLSPLLILMGTMMGVAGCIILPQQYPHSEMPVLTQAYVFHGSSVDKLFSLEMNLSQICWCCYGVCFQFLV